MRRLRKTARKDIAKPLVGETIAKPPRPTMNMNPNGKSRLKRKAILTICALPLLLCTLKADTGSAFYGDAPDEHHPWAVHDHNRPQPPRVEPKPYDAEKAKAPADAVVLFGGAESDLSKWEADKGAGEPTKWIVQDGTFQCVPGSGYVRTKDKFGDSQLHVEWAAPTPPHGDSQGRGNSGIFLKGIIEIQVLDNYDNPTYADGFACSMYGVSPPLANALRPPGEFQSIDITFRSPVYQDGKLVENGFVTVYCNGVIVQDHTQIEGGTGHKSRSKPRPFPDAGPLKLQDHGNPVRYKNIWIRPLPDRTAAEKATTLTILGAEETKVKRAEIAKTIRDDSEKLEGSAKMFRLYESLVYEKNDDAEKQASSMAAKVIEAAEAAPANEIDSKKGEITQLHNALAYLAKFKVIADDTAILTQTVKLIKTRGWDKK
jgi:hypothetical protein